MKPQRPAHPHFDPRLFRQSDDGLALLDRRGRRPFQEDMHPLLRRRLGKAKVFGGRHGDEDGIDLF